MEFSPPLLEARLLRRYKRFLADIEWPNGQRATVYCPDTGRMSGMQAPGSRIAVSKALGSRRKYPFTWELVEVDGHWVGVHAARANTLVLEALQLGQIAQLAGYPDIAREPRLARGRLDLHLSGHADGEDCFVEIKSVTAVDSEGCGLFPDARSTRATRHLGELIKLRESGSRAVMCWCVQRGGVHGLRPADEIDPEFGTVLRRAVARGVELIAVGCAVSPMEIRVTHRLRVDL